MYRQTVYESFRKHVWAVLQHFQGQNFGIITQIFKMSFLRASEWILTTEAKRHGRGANVEHSFNRKNGIVTFGMDYSILSEHITIKHLRNMI